MNTTREQQEAIEHKDGPLLVLAGAGSGKTFVITQRVLNLIQKGVNPAEILAVTFTNKAAREMKERIYKGSQMHIWVGTFHSFGVSILRQYKEALGRSEGFIVYDDTDQKALVKKGMEVVNGPWADKKPEIFVNQISRLKDSLITPEDLDRSTEPIEEYVKSLYSYYQKELIKNNAFDFGDLILEPVRLFQSHPHILEEYQERYKYILVDEYQDTNKAQDILVTLLAERYKNLCVVGDPDQSIYSWRGAHIDHILSFSQRYRGTKKVVLEKNYRSTEHILEAANEVIVKNTERLSKRLSAVRGAGEKIKIIECADQDREAQYVVEKIKEFIRQGGSRAEVGVLYRMNALSRSIEKDLALAGIPYRVVGGLKFYQRKEIKDALSYLRLLANPRDQVAFSRIVYTPRRGIGPKRVDAFLQFVKDRCEDNVISGMKEVELCPGLPTAAKRSLYAWGELWEYAQKMCEKEEFCSAFEELLKKSGYIAMLEKEEKADSKIENIKALISDMTSFKEREESFSIADYLEAVALFSEATEEDGQEEESISLMTMHAAKGLEFDCCFLIGYDEGIFPSSRSQYDPFQAEEERRLCYVAMTRARKKLHISTCARRLLHGHWAQQRPSIFLRDIDKSHTEYLVYGAQDAYDPYQAKRQERFEMRTKKGPSQKTTASIEKLSPSSSQGKFSLGQNVRHQSWGKGIILSVEGEGENQRGEVFFPHLGKKKKLMFERANLEVCS